MTSHGIMSSTSDPVVANCTPTARHVRELQRGNASVAVTRKSKRYSDWNFITSVQKLNANSSAKGVKVIDATFLSGCKHCIFLNWDALC